MRVTSLAATELSAPLAQFEQPEHITALVDYLSLCYFGSHSVSVLTVGYLDTNISVRDGNRLTVRQIYVLKKEQFNACRF